MVAPLCAVVDAETGDDHIRCAETRGLTAFAPYRSTLQGH
jgi:hypothetical protein